MTQTVRSKNPFSVQKKKKAGCWSLVPVSAKIYIFHILQLLILLKTIYKIETQKKKLL